MVGGALTVATYLAVPSGLARDAVYLAVGLSSVVAVLVGVQRNRPARRAAWYWLAAGQLLWVAGDTLYSWYNDVAGVSPYPSTADLLYLTAYPLLAVCFALLIRARRRGRDIVGRIDASIVTVSLGLLAWVVLAGPIVRSGDGTVFARAVGLAYPAGDVLLLAMVVRLVIGPGARTVAFRLLVAAGSLMYVADTAFSVLSAASAYEGGAVDPLWLAAYVAWGAAALHPSMRSLSERGNEPHTLTSRRLAGLTVAVLIAPCTLIVQLVLGVPLDAWPVALCSIAAFVLVVARMSLAGRAVETSTAQRDRLRDDLTHQAAHDSLTNVANRVRALEVIEAALHRGRRTGSHVGLLFVNLDHFKAVNDSHGHAVGDEVLREMARRMRGSVSAGDTVGRLGGNEFVVVVEALDSEAALVALAERLVTAIAEPVSAGGHDVVASASIGVAVVRDGSTDADELLRGANVASHRAKAAGRGRAEVFDEGLRRELQERTALESAMRVGLADNELELHYQPIVAVTTGRVDGYEALVRWHRPGHGLVPPDAFIPTAELSDLICDLGRWVLGEATRQLAGWMTEWPDACREMTVAVNISGRHLASASIVADVATALASAGLPADRLVLEITETVLVDQPAADAHLRALRELGVAVSIDDFGTGYTSISQLQHLSVDILKIDRSLVEASTSGAIELVRLVIAAAHAFGLTVVAEGVENEGQLSSLKLARCDTAQGYFFARPAPASVIAGVLADSATSTTLETQAPTGGGAPRGARARRCRRTSP
jgi:diguanylate cyclase (GGDEF)-like protein